MTTTTCWILISMSNHILREKITPLKSGTVGQCRSLKRRQCSNFSLIWALRPLPIATLHASAQISEETRECLALILATLQCYRLHVPPKMETAPP